MQLIGFERHTFYELVLSYYRAHNHLCGAEHDIDILRHESTDAVDSCWSTVDEQTMLQVSYCYNDHKYDDVLDDDKKQILIDTLF